MTVTRLRVQGLLLRLDDEHDHVGQKSALTSVSSHLNAVDNTVKAADALAH
jgi:hypothetical protein